MSRTIRLLCFAGAALAGLAQQRDNQERTLNCDERRHSGRLASHCEMREQTLAATGRLTIDGGKNGGVAVKGWGGREVLVRARVQTGAETEAEARELAGQIRVNASEDRVAADGPSVERRQNWSVTYEVFVPNRYDLNLTVHNGGVAVLDVLGNIEFSAVNGGVKLQRVGGRVRGHTTNGGLQIELTGNRWEGEGLDVKTTNGGVTMLLPDGYSARLETSTVNGGTSIDFPVTVQGNIGRRLEATLGAGGPTLRAVTTNGGVRIRRSAQSI